MKKYLATDWEDEIKEVECVRETAKQVVIHVIGRNGMTTERRCTRITPSEAYCSTHAEAVTWKENSLYDWLEWAYRAHQRAEERYVDFCKAHNHDPRPIDD